MSQRVTAIVLNWCSEDDTAACLESLAASRYDALTVLLVDNASPDGSGARLHRRFPDVAYLQTGTNLGYAAGNNRGFTWALERGADYVLVLNDDTVIDPSAVDLLVRAAEETGAAAAAPRILYFDEPERIWYGGGAFSPRRALGLHLHEDEPAAPDQPRSAVSFICGCCFLVRADVLRRLGGFDESYFAYAEDAEFSYRLARAGLTMVHEPRARVLHRLEPRAQPTPFQIAQRDRTRRRLVAQHYAP
ncbi:MAG TPA: glycosyltransferase family 2 protein, partial [Gemmatimonadaceae bacterium]|nr:glycosyltransferase family 2 protein [Gemmatimonadaceae bacterium]